MSNYIIFSRNSFILAKLSIMNMTMAWGLCRKWNLSSWNNFLCTVVYIFNIWVYYWHWALSFLARYKYSCMTKPEWKVRIHVCPSILDINPNTYISNISNGLCANNSFSAVRVWWEKINKKKICYCEAIIWDKETILY